MRFTYCPQCGAALGTRDLGDEGPVPFCESCDRPFFPFSYPCVLVVVVNEDNEVILLDQHYLSTEHKVLVAGYMKPGESAEEAAVREVAEETGQAADDVRYVASYHHPTRDLFILGMLVRARKRPFNSSPEVDAVDWFPLDGSADRLLEGSTSHRLLLAVTDLLATGE
jgi:NAD+ diphosphatase